MTQTVSGSRNSGSFILAAVIPPIGGSVEIDGSEIIVRTFICETRITTENYVAFRFYMCWALLNYRIIIEYEGAYRAVDFRGRGSFKNPEFFDSLGYKVARVDRFWRGSLDAQDGEIYGLDFSGLA